MVLYHAWQTLQFCNRMAEYLREKDFTRHTVPISTIDNCRYIWFISIYIYSLIIGNQNKWGSMDILMNGGHIIELPQNMKESKSLIYTRVLQHTQTLFTLSYYWW